jgi:hypothetical protein
MVSHILIEVTIVFLEELSMYQRNIDSNILKN